jgi:hypothetical protein
VLLTEPLSCVPKSPNGPPRAPEEGRRKPHASLA